MRVIPTEISSFGYQTVMAFQPGTVNVEPLNPGIIKAMKKLFAIIFLVIFPVCSFALEDKTLSEEKIIQTGTLKVGVGNVRALPTVKSLVIDKLIRGNSISIIAKEKKWYHVKLDDGRLGWIHQDLLILKDNSSKSIPAGIEKKEDLHTLSLKVRSGRVRKAPFLTSEIIAGLKKGDNVSIVEEKDDWYHIRLKNGLLGWANKSLFSIQSKPWTAKIKIDRKIKKIRFLVTPEGDEKVLFSLDHVFPPRISVIEGKEPKVVCNFIGAKLEQGIGPNIKVDGNSIQKIFINKYQDNSKDSLRVELDLSPKYNYKVEQIFFAKEQLYILTVKSIEMTTENGF